MRAQWKGKKESAEVKKPLVAVAEAVFGLWVLGALYHYYHQMGFGAFIMDLFS
jgi:hypothetical protein